MFLRKKEVGSFETCCYIVGGDDSRDCVIIDPGDDVEGIVSLLEASKRYPAMVLATHSHVDHIGGVDGILERYPGSTLAASGETLNRMANPGLNLSAFIGEAVAVRASGRPLADREKFSAAGLDWEALEIPGHDPGEMVYAVAGSGALFAGDVVFAGSVGRSDFPGGDGEQLAAAVKRLLASLPPETKVYPGHGPETTAGRELASNPFLL